MRALLYAVTVSSILALIAIPAPGRHLELGGRPASQLSLMEENELEDEARAVLRAIAVLVMGAEHVPHSAAPLSSDSLRFHNAHSGVRHELRLDGEAETVITWSPSVAPEVQGPSTGIALTRNAAPYLEGEVPDGMDNNGNGLIDERGLSFITHGHEVAIRLTLEARNHAGVRHSQTVETTVMVARH